MQNSSNTSNSHSARPRKRQRRSRDSNRTIRHQVSSDRRNIPCYELLDHNILRKLEQHADWLLENTGIEFRGDDTALELFRNAGANVEGNRVRFEAGLVRELCKTAPAMFTLHARDPKYSVTLGGEHIVLMPGYGSPFVTDLDNGRRYATLADFHNFVKLTWLTPYLHHSGGSVCEPTDIAVNKRHLDMTYAHLRLSAKPFMGAVTSPARATDTIELARIVFGSVFMQEHTVMQGNINVNSPFIYDGVMSAALRTYAEANQCVCVSPAIFGGAMGPVSVAAVCAQTLAEGMAGIALAQLVRAGCPSVLGSFHTTMNLRTGSLTFGTPEANLGNMVLAQLGRRLGVPIRSGGGHVTAANAADGQAMMDSANAMWSTLLSGSHQIWHAAGWLEGGLTMSYEKFIMDVDNCGALLRMLQGVCVDEESLSRESYTETSPGDNFLSTTHTLAHYASANYESLLPDTGPFERWRENDGLSADHRANSVYKRMLSDYTDPAMDDSIDQQLKEFITQRKSEMPDEWY